MRNRRLVWMIAAGIFVLQTATAQVDFNSVAAKTGVIRLTVPGHGDASYKAGEILLPSSGILHHHL